MSDHIEANHSSVAKLKQAISIGRLRGILELYIVAFIGGWLAYKADLPAAWLIGALMLVAVVQLAGHKASMPNWLRDVGMAQVGLVLGTGFSPKTVEAIATWPLSIAFLAVTVVIISWAAYAVLRKVGQWDHATALFASLPGALSYVMVIAETAGADMTRVAVAQTIRVFAVIAIVPILLSPFTAKYGSAAPAVDAALDAPVASVGLMALGLMTLAVAMLAPIVLRLGIPAGLLLAGMLVSGSLYLTGGLEAPLPGWFTIPSFLTIGIMVGSRFGAITLNDLMRLSGISLLSLFVSVLASVIPAFMVAEILGLPIGQVFLAFSPGGLETMVLLSFLFNLNPAYVAGHHLARYLGLVLLAPVITSRLTRKSAVEKKKVPGG